MSMGQLLAHQSFDLGAIAWVNAEERQLLHHSSLSNVEHQVEVLPELLLHGLSRLRVEFNLVQAKSVPHSVGGFETFVTLEVVQLALLGHDEQVERRGLGKTDKPVESSVVSFTDLAGLASLSNGVLKHMLTVVLPHAAEVRLVGDNCGHLMGENQHVLLHKVGSHLSESLEVCLELTAAFFSCCVDTENQRKLLIGVCE